MTVNPGYSGTPVESLDPKAVIEVCLCHHIRRGARVLTRHYDAALAPSGLTAGQFIILNAIAASQPMAAPVLRKLLAMDRTSLSRTLIPLRAAGFIKVSPGSGRRAGRLSLTAEGATVLHEAGGLWRGAQASASARLGGARTGQLLSILAALAEVLTDY